MRKIICAALAIGLVAGALAMPATAKKKKVKPVATTLFLDGTSNFGEEDQTGTGGFLKLSATEGTGEKSMGLFNLVASPNTNCAGNSLMPNFVGPVAGHIQGDLKLTFSAMATVATKTEIRVWPDLAAQACNDNYIAPAGSVVVDLPAGEGSVEATIEGLDFVAGAGMMIQFTSVLGAPPSYARIFYGTADSKVEFLCTPASGASCI